MPFLLEHYSIPEFFSFVNRSEKGWGSVVFELEKKLGTIQNQIIVNLFPLLLSSDFNPIHYIENILSKEKLIEEDLNILKSEERKKTLENDIETLKKKQIEKVQEYENECKKYNDIIGLTQEKNRLIQEVEDPKINKDSDVYKRANAMFAQFKNRLAKDCFFGSLAFLVVCAFVYNVSRFYIPYLPHDLYQHSNK